MTKKQHYMTEKERYKLEGFLDAGKPVAWIAQQMGFCRKTIYNEIKRGTYNHNVDFEFVPRYSADKAQQIFEYRQTAKGRPLKIGNDHAFANFLEEKMLSKDDRRKRCSPAVALELARRAGFTTRICVSTLYSYIYKGVFLELSAKDLWEKPKRKPRKKKDETKEQRITHPQLPSISIRPQHINERSELGHKEMDLIISSGNKRVCLLTFTDRMSREETIIKLPNHEAKTVRKAIDRLERQVPGFRQKFQTITTDNGPEFLEYDQLIRSARSKRQRFEVYYCHPYSSWEKGTVEVHNRMIRRWFPKGTDFTGVKPKEIAALQEWMNSYPRKILGWRTPAEVAAGLSLPS